MAKRKIRSPLSGGKKFEGGAKILTRALVKSFKIGKAVAKLSSKSMAKSSKPIAYRHPIGRTAPQTSTGCMGFLLLLVAAFLFYLLAP